jgi:hypothetical protein
MLVVLEATKALLIKNSTREPLTYRMVNLYQSAATTATLDVVVVLVLASRVMQAQLALVAGAN